MVENSRHQDIRPKTHDTFDVIRELNMYTIITQEELFLILIVIIITKMFLLYSD